MHWGFGMTAVGQPNRAVVYGSRTAGGAHLEIQIEMRLEAWATENIPPQYLALQPGAVVARCGAKTLRLGYAIPDARDVVVPGSEPRTQTLRFGLDLSNAALDELERMRDGGDIALEIEVVGHAYRAERYMPPATMNYRFDLKKEDWLKVLTETGYCETLLVELRLPETNTAAGAHLADAIAERNAGRYAKAIAACRVALESLSDTPNEESGEIDLIVKARRTALDDRQRFVMLRTAAYIFCSKAVHGRTDYPREDADMAISMTASVLRVSPRFAAAG
jgi:hypothetical protein